MPVILQFFLKSMSLLSRKVHRRKTIRYASSVLIKWFCFHLKKSDDIDPKDREIRVK